MLLGALGASLLGNMLAGKGLVRAGYGNKKGKGIARASLLGNMLAGKGTVRDGYGNEKNF